MWDNWAKVLTQANLERLLIGDFLSTGEIGGFLLTIILGFASIAFATVLGIAIGIARQSQFRVIKYAAGIYINIFRSIPVLVIIFWAYFLPYQVFGFSASPFYSALFALSLFTSAYIAEIVRSGLISVSPQQVHAARVLGFNRLQIYRYVVIPQALFVMIPALAGRYIVTIKNTSLAFLIGLSEVTEIGRQINARLMTAPIQVYMIILILYFILNMLIGRAMGMLESRSCFNRLFSPVGSRLASGSNHSRK